jgi:hypothetical protein
MPGRRVAVDGTGGRPLVAGTQVLPETNVPRDGSVILAFSLYTDDDPRNVPALRAPRSGRTSTAPGRAAA